MCGGNAPRSRDAVQDKRGASGTWANPGYIGPDHRIMDMQSFYRALVQALQAARAEIAKWIEPVHCFHAAALSRRGDNLPTRFRRVCMLILPR